MNRKIVIFGGLVLAGLALGACGGAAFECTDAIGCVDIAPDEPIHIAAVNPVTTGASVYGEAATGGINIAIAEQGQLLGLDILLSVEDSACSSEGGESAFQRVAADPTIVGVIGTTCSSAMTAAMSAMSGAGLVAISPSVTGPAMTDPARLWQEGFFRTAHNDIFQSAMDANFAYNDLGARSAATVHDGDAYTEGLATEFAAAFEALGGTITAAEAINKGDTDMRPVLTTIAADSPDVLFFPIFQPEGDFIAAQSVEIPGLEDTILFGADGLFVAPFGPSAGTAALDMYMSGPYFDDPAVDAFLASFEALTGGPPPGPFGEHAYDAMNMLMDAIEAVGVVDDDGTVHIGRQALRDAVEATSGFVGLTGVLECSPKEIKPGITFRGDCATGEALAIYQVDQAWIDSTDGYPPEPVFVP